MKGVKTALICLLFAFSVIAAEEEFVYESGRKRDPFIPLVTPEGALLKLEPYGEDSEVKLEGIIYDREGNSLAIVNGKVVKKGDVINGCEVFKIEKDRVFLIKEGEILEVGLNTGGINEKY